MLATVAALLAWRRPALAAPLALALAPWQGLAGDSGLRLSAYLAALAGLGLAWLRAGPRLPRDPWLLALLAWVCLSTLLALPWRPEAAVAGGDLRGGLARPLVQCLSFLLLLFPAWALAGLHRRGPGPEALARVYLGSVAALAALGWVQLALWSGGGADPLPLNAVEVWLRGAEARHGQDFWPGNVWVHRMGSLAGEPKWLAVALALALTVLQLAWAGGARRFGAAPAALWAFLAAALVATQSVSGLYLWLAGALLSVLALAGTGARRRAIHPLTLLAVAAALATLALAGGDSLATWAGRAAERGVLADFDAAVWAFLADSPGRALLGVGLGNVHLYADAFLPEGMRYAAGTAFVAESGLLRLLSELGLVGTVLFLGWALGLARGALAGADPAHRVAGWVALAATLFFLARGGVSAPYLFFALGAAALVREPAP